MKIALMSKGFLSLFSIFCMASLMSLAIVPDAEAKRFGGGGFGKSYKSSPFAKKKVSPSQKQTDQKNGQALNGGKKRSGLMGGMLGGLLAGGLFAALLGSGAFEGLQLMDILLMAGLAFIVIRLLKGMAKSQAPRPQAAGHAPLSGQPQNFQAQQQHSGSVDEVPMNLPEGFDQDEFLNIADQHYRELQKAWNEGNLEMIQEFVSTEIYQTLAQQREKLMVPPQTEILDLTCDIVRGDYNQQQAGVSILFKGRCKDDLEKSEDGIFDIWHLERDLTESNSPWLIVGIEAE